MTDVLAKAVEMAAEPMTTSQLDRWLQGKIPRRHLAVPFGGPNPSKASPLGVDNQGEWFDEDTDLYGDAKAYPELRPLHESRHRLVDWHHVTALPRQFSDPTRVMDGAILGYMTLDKEASTEEIEGEAYYGVWADIWANAGEKRRLALGALERRNATIFGSSVPVAKAAVIAPNGHIDVWPIRWQGLTVDPVNRRAVLSPLAKAELNDYSNIAELPVGALRAYLTGEDNLGDLRSTSAQGEIGAKAGRVLSGVNEQDLDDAVTALEQALDRARGVLSRARERTTQSNV